MPKRSNISRSCNSQLRQTGVSEGSVTLVGSIPGAQPEDQRSLAQRHGIKMIDRFEEAGVFRSASSSGLLFHSLNHLLDFDFLLDCFSGQSTPVTLEA